MAARTAALVPPGALVLALGDMAYQYADAATLASCYEPTWGRHRRTTIAIPGNHDYVAGDASAFIDYFRPVSAPGAEFIAHTRRLTDHWLLVALDSNVSGSALEAQYRWLEESLAAERARRRRTGVRTRDVARTAVSRRGCIAAPATTCVRSGNCSTSTAPTWC